MAGTYSALTETYPPTLTVTYPALTGTYLTLTIAYLALTGNYLTLTIAFLALTKT